MSLDVEELVRAAEIVAECKGMKVAVKCSLVGAGVAGACSFTGGLLLGPVGLFTGATLGGLLSYSMTKNKFKPVVQVLKEELSNAQKNRLASHMQNALQNLEIQDFVKLMLILKSDSALQVVLFDALKMFLEGEMKLQVLPA